MNYKKMQPCETLYPFLADRRISGIIKYILKIVCLNFNDPARIAFNIQPECPEELEL
jgi:hypothetical protein